VSTKVDTALMGAAIEATVHIHWAFLRRYFRGMFRCRLVPDASFIAHQKTSLVDAICAWDAIRQLTLCREDKPAEELSSCTLAPRYVCHEYHCIIYLTNLLIVHISTTVLVSLSSEARFCSTIRWTAAFPDLLIVRFSMKKISQP